MTDLGLLELRAFKGSLTLNDSSCALDFSARLGPSGEVELDLGKLPLDKDTQFILQGYNNDGPEFKEFAISGTADDGTLFTTDDLHFTSLKQNWSKAAGATLAPAASCLTAQFKRQVTAPASAPMLRMRLKGFRNFGSLHAETQLGTISMDGPSEILDPNRMTGLITLQAPDIPADLTKWRAQGKALLEHVRLVMSFASASILRAPVQEYYAGEQAEVTCYSQTKQAGSQLRVFHYLNQQPVFEVAVNSYFHRREDVKKVFFAIEWFAMDTTYMEVRLVSAMTALENLVDSNLDESDALIQHPNEFKKTRRELHNVIRACLAKWQPEAAKEASRELNEKLAELNRRSLLLRFKLLVRRWQVPLDGISEASILEAKKARDRVVHRGKYYGDGEQDETDLWTHVTVLQEIVTRFLLTAIGYKGRYLSYIGRCHDAEFPPRRSA